MPLFYLAHPIPYHHILKILGSFYAHLKTTTTKQQIAFFCNLSLFVCKVKVKAQPYLEQSTEPYQQSPIDSYLILNINNSQHKLISTEIHLCFSGCLHLS